MENVIEEENLEEDINGMEDIIKWVRLQIMKITDDK